MKEDNFLQEGTYSIPDDCTAVYVDRKVVVKKKIVRPIKPHCSDCIHQKLGKKTMRNQWWDSYYCDAKPKIINGQEGYFYNAQSSKVACVKYEPKNK